MEEIISVICPSCGTKVNFHPKILGVEVNDKYKIVEPNIRVILQTGNLIPHDCEEVNLPNPNQD